MKFKAVAKILLDVGMTILFVILVFGFGTGMLFHELAGIAIFLLYGLHLALNANWLKLMLKKGAFRAASERNRQLFVLDAALFVGMTAIVATGVLISQVLFPLGIVSDMALTSQIHNIVSYVCLGILGVHILFHAKYLAASFRAMFRKGSGVGIRKAAAGAAALIAVFAVVYCKLFPWTDSSAVAQETPQSSLLLPSAASQTSSETTSEESSEPAAGKETESIGKQSQSDDDNDDSDSDPTPGNDSDNDDDADSSQVLTSSSAAPSSSETAAPAVSLSEYLGKLICTGCGKRCSLLNPHCGRGAQQASAATQQYNSLYNIG